MLVAFRRCWWHECDAGGNFGLKRVLYLGEWRGVSIKNSFGLNHAYKLFVFPLQDSLCRVDDIN